VTRAEVEEIRGVALGKGTLDALMESGWIKPGKRKQTPGRPVTWLTTEAFLEHFGLDSLTDLPGLEELKAAGLLDARPTSLGDSAEASTEPEDESDAEREEIETELGLEPAEEEDTGDEHPKAPVGGSGDSG
jgi:segregation and condensation protein B